MKILDNLANNIKEVNYGNIGKFSNFIDEIMIEKAIKITNNTMAGNYNQKS